MGHKLNVAGGVLWVVTETLQAQLKDFQGYVFFLEKKKSTSKLLS